LNKTDQGHEELRQAVREADAGQTDLELLYRLAKEYLEQLEDIPDRRAIERSLHLLDEIAGALGFAGMTRESCVMEQCQRWLTAAGNAGSVREDEAFRCFADAFAHIELHLQRSLIDPLGDTSHLLACAERRAAELERWLEQVSPGADITNPVTAETSNVVQDEEISADFLQVFLEESEEIVTELGRLGQLWAQDPQANQVLRDMRRHFHTFKGNGRAVGANILGELGWAAQDMLDRVLDGEVAPTGAVQDLVKQLIAALPSLVSSYRNTSEFDPTATRQLTNRCFSMGKSGGAATAGETPPVEQIPRGPTGLAAQAPAAGSIGQ
jgi:chemotaxis protein histidine kinase CheA